MADGDEGEGKGSPVKGNQQEHDGGEGKERPAKGRQQQQEHQGHLLSGKSKKLKCHLC